ncbi:hypothetical protein FRC10_011022 [Ceratobasidium sp. 414]|nr:hypothetical protein FRC10_011022 [Ceratobasidium sp. 414]
MLGRTALAAARAIRTALGTGDAAQARTILGAYDGPSRLPLTALVHGVMRTQRPLIAAVAVENHIENARTLRTSTLQAYISSLAATQSQFFNQNISSHTPTTAALTILAAARRSRRQQRTSHMYDAAIRACLLQGEILTGSLLFVLLVRDWQKRRRPPTDPPPEPPPPALPPLNSPLRRWKRSFPTHFTSAIPADAPTVPFPSPHLLEAILASLDLRPRKNPQAESLPPGRPPDSILALAHFARLFAEGLLPFGRVAALLKAMTIVPPCPEQKYFRDILRSTMDDLPEIDTRAYNVLINYALSILEQPLRAQQLVNHMSTIRDPPLRITDATRAIILRGEVKLRKPGLAARILSHIDSRGHCTNPPDDSSAATPAPLASTSASAKLPENPHLLAAYIHNYTSVGQPNRVLSLLFDLIPELDLPPPPSRASFKSATKRAIRLGPSVLTALLNALYKAGKTGLAERVWRLGCAAQSENPSFGLPIAFHTIILQLYAREARKGLVVVSPDPFRTVRAIVDASVVHEPPPRSTTAYGWGFATPLPELPGISPETVGRVDSLVRRWLLARHSAAEIYTRHIRPYLPLSSNPRSAHQLTPDARLWNALFDTFGRRVNMYVRTHISYLDRHRIARIKIRGPKQVDGFMRVVLQDMCECEMAGDIPSGWRHLVADEWRSSLPPLPPSNPHYKYKAQRQREWKHKRSREKQGQDVVGRWRVRETRLRPRFGIRHGRAQAWAKKTVHATWPKTAKRAMRRGLLGRRWRASVIGTV